MPKTNRVIVKLEHLMGEKAAGELIGELMRELELPDLDSPSHRDRFGEALVRRGGVYEVLGRAIRVQAALQGAKPNF
jgi:hypothetical protein